MKPRATVQAAATTAGATLSRAGNDPPASSVLRPGHRLRYETTDSLSVSTPGPGPGPVPTPTPIPIPIPNRAFEPLVIPAAAGIQEPLSVCRSAVGQSGVSGSGGCHSLFRETVAPALVAVGLANKGWSWSSGWGSTPRICDSIQHCDQRIQNRQRLCGRRFAQCSQTPRRLRVRPRHSYALPSAVRMRATRWPSQKPRDSLKFR